MPGVLIDLGEMSRQSTINVAPDQDPASAIPGMPPAFGQWMMPHVLSFSGTVGSLSKVYRPSDEALQDSWDNARLIRNDLSVMECVEGRQRCVALLNWHLEPDNPKDPVQFEVAQHLTEICRKIPRFMQYRENLLHATFFGKYGVLNRWRWRRIAGRWRIAPDRWRPVHGDKIIFRYDPDSREWQDDQVGIRVGAMHVAHSLLHNRWPVEKVRQVAPTSEGLAYFLRAHERSLIAVHKHYVEDGEYEVPQNAGRIHGVGIRSRIYWTWYQKQETLAWLMEYLERSAGGFEIWYYPQGNPTAKEEVYKAARDRLSLGRNVILVPRTLGEPGAQPYDRIEPSMAGAEALKAIVVEYFGHQIKRYILGQTLTTEASNTGLGSNTADVHLATFYTIVEYDAQLLEETLTDDLIGPLMRYNFPWAQFGVRFKIDTKSDDAQEKMAAFLNAYQMGLKIKAQDVMDLVGASKPEPGDEVLWIGNRQQQGGVGGMPGMGPPGMGGPPGAPAGPGDVPQDPNPPSGDHEREVDGSKSPGDRSQGDANDGNDGVVERESTTTRERYSRSSEGEGNGPENPEFERKHPRDNQGRFARVFTGQLAGLDEIPEVNRNELPAGYAFFTTKRDVAALYAGTHPDEVEGKSGFSTGRKGSVYQASLAIERPIDLDKFDEDEWARALLPDVDIDEDGYTNRQIAEAMELEAEHDDEDRPRKVTGYLTPGGRWFPPDFDTEDVIKELWEENSASGVTLQHALDKATLGQAMVLFPEAGKRYIDHHKADGFYFRDSEMGGVTVIPFFAEQIQLANALAKSSKNPTERKQVGVEFDRDSTSEQYARKAAPGQMSLFGNEGPKDPEFEQQHPREPDGTFREKNASESSASAAVPHADELKRKATGEHKEEDLEEADLKRRYEEYAVAMHQARITPRPWEQWKEAVAGTRAQGGKAPDPKPAGDPEGTALRKRYEQYVHDVSSHGITPRPWEQWRQHLQRNVTPPTVSDESTAAEPSVPVSPPTAKPPHETPLSHYKDGGMLPAELYDGLHRANDEESGFVVRVDKKQNGKYDVYLEGSHHKHLKSPYATDVDQDVARTAAWRAAGFSPENATILPSRVIENHRKLVREALERGDKVPEEVLRDYPELRPRVTTADPENPTVPPSEEEMNPLDLDEDLGEPGSGKAFEDELETESNEADVDEDADDPREAARRHAKALQDGYAYARASAVGNAGEDLLGSARHKINQWKGLESAESEGRGEELVTREHLLKGEPVDMLRHVTATNCLSSLAMHAAMGSFPPKPYDPADRYYGRQTDEVKKRYRANYVDAYRTIKATAEQLARDEVDPKKALDQLRSVVAAEIVRIRQERLPYDPVANNLVNLQNRLSTYGRPKPNAPLGQVFEFVGRLKAAYGQDQITRDTLDKAAEHVRDVMEGDSLNKTFGTVGQGGKPKGFSAAEMYVTHATRKGGRVIDAETVKAGQDFVIDTLGMRGLQFGNYVTDEERQHHLRMSAEALADLMDVTGLPDRQASLDGVIGLAIGARGTSRALATYEPGNKVINLTRKGGVGSLAHEWGHAFDHHVAGGKLTSDLSGRSSGDYQSERLSAIRHERTDQGWQRVDLSEDPMHKAYDGLRQAWKQSGFLEQVKATGQRVFGEAWKTKRNYWMSNRELFARSFEVYVARQLSKQDRENTYLSGLNPVGDAAPLWPSQEQVDEMAPHFAAIFAAYRDRLQQPERSDPTPADASHQQEKYSLIHALNAATYQPRVVT